MRRNAVLLPVHLIRREARLDDAVPVTVDDGRQIVQVDGLPGVAMERNDLDVDQVRPADARLQGDEKLVVHFLERHDHRFQLEVDVGAQFVKLPRAAIEEEVRVRVENVQNVRRTVSSAKVRAGCQCQA